MGAASNTNIRPERIKALSLEEKREALALLEASEIPRLERLARAVRNRTPAQQDAYALNYAEISAEFQSRDFLSRICGEDSPKPSGKTTRGWYH